MQTQKCMQMIFLAQRPNFNKLCEKKQGLYCKIFEDLNKKNIPHMYYQFLTVYWRPGSALGLLAL